MTYLNTNCRRAAFVVGIAALCAAIPAHADQQYQEDRTYCMSGQASEARDLCLKEAAAAQADRQQAASGTSHRKHASARQSPEKASDTHGNNTR
jgi:hypothetical protein